MLKALWQRLMLLDPGRGDRMMLVLSVINVALSFVVFVQIAVR